MLRERDAHASRTCDVRDVRRRFNVLNALKQTQRGAIYLVLRFSIIGPFVLHIGHHVTFHYGVSSVVF